MESEDRKPIFTRRLLLIILAVILIIIIIILLLKRCGNGSGTDPDAVSSVGINPPFLNMEPGATAEIYAEVYPSTAKEQTVYWDVEDPSCVTISPTGNYASVTANNTECQTTITVRTLDGNYQASCDVTISKNLPQLTDIQLNQSKYTVNVGSRKLVQVSPAPTDAPLPELTYTIENPSIATVSSSGVITGVSVGTTTLIVETETGLRATATVVVTKKNSGGGSEEDTPTYVKVTAIDYPKTANKEVCVGKSIYLDYVITPNNATNKKVNYEILNDADSTKLANKYAKIDANTGYLTGTTAGTVKVKFISKDNSNIFVQTDITVLSSSNSKCKSGGGGGGSTGGGSGSGSGTCTGSNCNNPTGTTTQNGGDGSLSCSVTYGTSAVVDGNTWYDSFKVTWKRNYYDDTYYDYKYHIGTTSSGLSGTHTENFTESNVEMYGGQELYGTYKKTSSEEVTTSCGAKVPHHIDSTAPTCKFVNPTMSGNKITINLEATDTGSGIKKIAINNASQVYNADANATFTTYIDRPAGDKVAVSGIVYDMLGHTTACSATYDINNGELATTDAHITKLNLTKNSNNPLIAGNSYSFSAYYSKSDGKRAYPTIGNSLTCSPNCTLTGNSGSYKVTPNEVGTIKVCLTGQIYEKGEAKNDEICQSYNVSDSGLPKIEVQLNPNFASKTGDYYYGAGTIGYTVLNLTQEDRNKFEIKNERICHLDTCGTTISVPKTQSGSISITYKASTKYGEISQYVGSVSVDNQTPSCSLYSDGANQYKLVLSGNNYAGIKEIKCGNSTISATKNGSIYYGVSLGSSNSCTITKFNGNSNTCTPNLENECNFVYSTSDISVTHPRVFEFGKSQVQRNYGGDTAVTSQLVGDNQYTATVYSGADCIAINDKTLSTKKGGCTGVVKVTSNVCSGKSAYINVTVKEEKIDPSMTIQGESYLANAKATATYTASFNNPPSGKVTWKWDSSDNTCATIDATGKLTGKNSKSTTCTTTITATAVIEGVSSTYSTTKTVKVPGMYEEATINIQTSGAGWKDAAWTNSLAYGYFIVKGAPNDKVTVECTGVISCGNGGTLSSNTLQQGFSASTNGVGTITVKVIRGGKTINSDSKTFTTSKIDKEKPTCAINATASSLTATVNETGGSGIAATTSGWTKDGLNYTISGLAPGKAMTFVVVDGAGNEGSCSGTTKTSETFDCGTVVSRTNTNAKWTNQPVTITISCVGTDCAAATYSHTWDAKTYIATRGAIGIKSKSGKTKTCLVDVNYDPIAPTCSINADSTSQLTATITETGSGIATVSSGWHLQTTSKYIQTNLAAGTTKSLTVTDAAGNSASCSGTTVAAAPKVTISGTAILSAKGSASYTASLNPSPAGKITWEWDSSNKSCAQFASLNLIANNASSLPCYTTITATAIVDGVKMNDYSNQKTITVSGMTEIPTVSITGPAKLSSFDGTATYTATLNNPPSGTLTWQWTSDNTSCISIGSSTGKAYGTNTNTTACTASIKATAFIGGQKTSYYKSLNVTVPGRTVELFACGDVVKRTNADAKWTNQPVTITISCVGADCAAATYSYTWDTKTYIVAKGAIGIKSKSGKTNTCSVDVNYDPVAPKCSINADSTSQLTATITDSGSGIATVSSGWQQQSSSKYIQTNLKPGTKKDLTVTDVAGNSESCSGTTLSSTSDATITITTSGNGWEGTSWTTSSAWGSIQVKGLEGDTVSISCTGNLSCGNSGGTISSTKQFNRGFSFDKNGSGTVTVHVTRNGKTVGQQSRTVTANRIDKTAPTCTITASSTSLTAKVTESGSGIASVSSGWQNTAAGYYTINGLASGTSKTFTVTDNAGNIGKCDGKTTTPVPKEEEFECGVVTARTNSNASWSKNAVTVKISCIGKDCAKTEFSNVWNTTSYIVTRGAIGITSKSGKTKTCYVDVNYDPVKPKISCEVTSQGSSGVNVKVTSASDSGSGLKATSQSKIGQTYKFTVSGSITVEDNAGNTASCTVTVKKNSNTTYDRYRRKCSTSYTGGDLCKTWGSWSLWESGLTKSGCQEIYNENWNYECRSNGTGTYDRYRRKCSAQRTGYDTCKSWGSWSLWESGLTKSGCQEIANENWNYECRSVTSTDYTGSVS